jgi:hypothetical protein
VEGVVALAVVDHLEHRRLRFSSTSSLRQDYRYQEIFRDEKLPCWQTNLREGEIPVPAILIVSSKTCCDSHRRKQRRLVKDHARLHRMNPTKVTREKVFGRRSPRSCRSEPESRKELWSCIELSTSFGKDHTSASSLAGHHNYFVSIHITAIYIDSCRRQFILIRIVRCPIVISSQPRAKLSLRGDLWPPRTAVN